MIFDFRMSIADLLQLLPRRGGLSCCYCNRRELVRFLKQRLYSRCAQKLRGNNQFKRKASFVRFLLYHARLVDEVCSGFRSTKSAIVRAHRSSASNNLICDCVPAACSWKGIGQLQDSQCKGLGSFFHFAFIHAPL
jgi:hypothetical protein